MIYNAMRLHQRGKQMKMSRSRRGISLIEVIVAVALLSVGLVGLLTLLNESQRAGVRADREMDQAALALARLHELRLQAPQLAERLSSQTTGSLVLTGEKPEPFPDHPDYAYQASVSRNAETTNQLNLEIEVALVNPTAAASSKPVKIRSVVFVDEMTSGGAQ